MLERIHSHSVLDEFYVKERNSVNSGRSCNKNCCYIVMEMLQLFDYIVFVHEDGTKNVLLQCIWKYVIVI